MFYGLSNFESYYKDKVSIFVALAPVTMIPNTQVDAFKIGADLYDEIDDTFDLLGIHSVLNDTWYTSGTTALFCNAIPSLCLALEKLFVSSDPTYDD
jgi:hypothetical protein